MLSLMLTLAAIMGSEATARDDGLLAYLPFDGSAAIALGTTSGRIPAAALSYAEGVSGEAVRLVSDCRVEIGSDFPVAEGTFAGWIRHEYSDSTETPRYIFCLYGAPGLESSWARNRWSLLTFGSRLCFEVYGDSSGRPLTAQASVPDLIKGAWHHVAATWSGVNSSTGGATLRLYVDGAPVASVTAPRLDVGETSGQFDLGRDSDGSPDYGEMLLDDVFLYARALSAEEIAAGVAATAPSRVRPAPETPVPAGAIPDWDAPRLSFRCLLEAPAPKQERRDWFLYATPGLHDGLRHLGFPGVPDLARARLFARSPAGEWEERASQTDGQTLFWPVPGEWPAGRARGFRLYFDSLRYSCIAPLIVSPPSPVDRAGTLSAGLPDYAQEEYGDAWDFDEGDLEEIDTFGNRPELIRNVRVKDGALYATVARDAYVIWGSMWGPEDHGKRRVRIDLSRHPVLVLRLRQSVPFATWTVYGRPLGSESLVTHEFPVTGTGWQTVRVDLVREARWRGVLSALRLNLTKDVEADVALDFARIVRGSEAHAGALETRGTPSARAARVAIIPETQSSVAGTEQRLRVRVEDAAGKPVSRQPVRVWLDGEIPGAELRRGATPSLGLGATSRRALTDSTGAAEFRLHAGRVSGRSTKVFAETEFVGTEEASIEVAVRAGEPSRYAVGAPGVTIVPEEKTPLRLRVTATDICGNPVPSPGRALAWRIEEARDSEGSAVATEEGTEITLAPDMTRRWVYRARVKDERGLAGESGDICVLPKGPPARKIALRGGCFQTPDGRPFVPLGGFYSVWIPGIPAAGEEEGRRIRAFTDATEDEMRHWFGFLRSQGVTALRMMLRTHGPGGTEAMDMGGRVNRKLFARVLRLIDLARQRDLRFMFTLHDDYEKPVYVNERHLESFALPAFAGEDLGALPPYQRRFLLERDLVSPRERYHDPDAIACQDQYAREIVGYLKDNPALLAWELENEMVDCPVSWVNHAVETIRSVDPATPVCVSHGGGGLVSADPLYWSRTKASFYTYHLYPLGVTSSGIDYGLATDVLTRYGRMAGTCFLGESSGDEFNDYPVERDGERRWIMRDLIWLSLVNRNPGGFFWNSRGREIAEFRLAAEVLRDAPWLLAERPPAPVAVRVTHPLDTDTWYRTAEGQRDLLMMARYSRHFLERGVEFDFVAGDAAGGREQSCDLANFAPPHVTGRFTPSSGFQVASATRQDGLAGLLYVRCVSGIRSWNPKEDRAMWLRQRAPAPLQLVCWKPDQVRVTARDLDTGEERILTLGNGGVLDLGVTEHDFAVLWELQ